MRVRDLMKKEVFTVGPDDPVDRVFFLIQSEKIRHLPVVEERHVVGIVSDRDLYKALGPRSGRGPGDLSRDRTNLYVIPRKVRHMMRREVVTIDPDDPIHQAASTMARRKIGALPVVRDGELAGIITATDLLMALARDERARARSGTD